MAWYKCGGGSGKMKTAELTVTGYGTSTTVDFSSVTDDYGKIEASNIFLKSLNITQSEYSKANGNASVKFTVSSYDNTTGKAIINNTAYFPNTGCAYTAVITAVYV